jgi:cytochrome c peroxidase
MHSGHFDTLDNVVLFYHHAGEFARDHQLRNADPEIQNIALDHPELPDLVSFLESLDEDYDQP